MKNKTVANIISKLPGVLVLTIAFGSIALASDPWVGAPVGTPPGCPAGHVGCDTPINVGSVAQTKSGPLTVNGLTDTGATNLQGDVLLSKTYVTTHSSCASGEALISQTATCNGSSVFGMCLSGRTYSTTCGTAVSLTVGGKAYSQSTVDGDTAHTLVTKDYVDAVAANTTASAGSPMYVNSTEDIYGPGVAGGGSDSCDGGGDSQYICLPSDNKTCVDEYDSSHYKRRVFCSLALATVSFPGTGDGMPAFHFKGNVDSNLDMTLQGTTYSESNETAHGNLSNTHEFFGPGITEGLYLDILSSRGVIKVTQQPTVANGFTSEINISDGENGEGTYDFYLLKGAVFHFRGAVDGTLDMTLVAKDASIVPSYSESNELYHGNLTSTHEFLGGNVITSPLAIVKNEGRGSIAITQQPTAANGWTIKVSIGDGENGEAMYDFYLIRQ